jgi:hypothetical protein
MIELKFPNSFAVFSFSLAEKVLGVCAKANVED